MKVGNIAADNMAVGHLNRLKQRNSLGPSRDGQNYAVVHCTGYIKNWPPSGKENLQGSSYFEVLDTVIILFLWFYSRVPALTVPVMILHLSPSIAILFQMPTPVFLRSSLMLLSHLIGVRPTVLVPYNVANINILQGLSVIVYSVFYIHVHFSTCATLGLHVVD
jgi:hypothetical protein